MFEWFWSVIPEEYRWSVAIKKVSYTLAKVGIGLLAGSALGKHLNPEHLTAAENITAGLVAGGLTWIHDWLHMKFPDKKWL